MFFDRNRYHDFMNTQMYAENPPDLMIAFDSGHGDCEEEAWAPTLEKILDSEKPAVFTTYNKTEALQEEAVSDRLGTQLLPWPSENNGKA